MENIKIHNAGESMGHSVKDFYPLIGMTAVVLFLTTASSVHFGMTPMYAFMGWFFLLFGLLKVARLKSFVEAYGMYDVLARKSKVYAYAYPFLELGFGLSYLLMWQIQTVSVAVFIIMLIGAYGVYIKLKKKEKIPCACLGTVFKAPMTWVTLGEDLLMAGMALMILL